MKPMGAGLARDAEGLGRVRVAFRRATNVQGEVSCGAQSWRCLSALRSSLESELRGLAAPFPASSTTLTSDRSASQRRTASCAPSRQDRNATRVSVVSLTSESRSAPLRKVRLSWLVPLVPLVLLGRLAPWDRAEELA